MTRVNLYIESHASIDFLLKEEHGMLDKIGITREEGRYSEGHDRIVVIKML